MIIVLIYNACKGACDGLVVLIAEALTSIFQCVAGIHHATVDKSYYSIFGPDRVPRPNKS